MDLFQKKDYFLPFRVICIFLGCKYNDLFLFRNDFVLYLIKNHSIFAFSVVLYRLKWLLLSVFKTHPIFGVM